MQIIVIVAGLFFGGVSAPEAPPQSIRLRAEDGVDVSALVYEARQPKAVVLLFHQADSSKAEYATIAPRLANAGFTALAIDQRSGGSLYGPNETAGRLAVEATYEQAKPDLVAALEWGRSQHLPVILWGSSYSAALVFEVAAEQPSDVAAVVAFSPGEYLSGVNDVSHAAARVHAAIYVTSSASQNEVRAARAILAASPAKRKTQYVPQYGVHGASTLIAARNPKGASDNWAHVLLFLNSLSRDAVFVGTVLAPRSI